MPGYIVKPDPDTDYYVRWSAIVDAPTHGGTRAELVDHAGTEFAPERFDRADEFGTSCAIVQGSETLRYYGWQDDAPFWIGNGPGAPGTLDRSNLAAYTQAVLRGDTAAAVAVTYRLAEQDEPEQPVVLNPEAIGNPDMTPIVQLPPAMVAMFERTRCAECQQINHTHAATCSHATDD